MGEHGRAVVNTIWLCPGQGAQKIGMGKDLAERFPAARDVFIRHGLSGARTRTIAEYAGVSEAAYKTDALAKYGRDFPAALVARDQLPYSVAEFSTHDNQRVTKALNDGIQAALTGAKTPEQAMKDAQAEASRLASLPKARAVPPSCSMR